MRVPGSPIRGERREKQNTIMPLSFWRTAQVAAIVCAVWIAAEGAPCSTCRRPTLYDSLNPWWVFPFLLMVLAAPRLALFTGMVISRRFSPEFLAISVFHPFAAVLSYATFRGYAFTHPFLFAIGSFLTWSRFLEVFRDLNAPRGGAGADPPPVPAAVGADVPREPERGFAIELAGVRLEIGDQEHQDVVAAIEIPLPVGAIPAPAPAAAAAAAADPAPAAVPAGGYFEAFRRMKNRVEESEFLVRLLEGNADLIGTMTSLQLGSLLSSVRNGLGSVCSELCRRASQDPAVPGCSSCWRSHASVEMQPCGHTVLCSACAEAALDIARARGVMVKCPGCGVQCESFLSSARWAQPVSPERRVWQATEGTRQELKRAGIWRQHKRAIAFSKNP